MAEAVTNDKVQPKCPKAMDMRFHWLQDRECQNLLEARKVKLRRLWTKHHPTKNHQHMIKEFITPQIVLETLRQAKKAVEAKAALMQKKQTK